MGISDAGLSFRASWLEGKPGENVARLHGTYPNPRQLLHASPEALVVGALPPASMQSWPSAERGRGDRNPVFGCDFTVSLAGEACLPGKHSVQGQAG
jgi:hypothetical protein